MPVVVFRDNFGEDSSSVYDIENGTIFTILNNSTYVFKDKYGNVWSTVPDSHHFKGVPYYPSIGTKYNRHNGITVCFVAKEEVEALAIDYFRNFIDLLFGLKIIVQEFLFYADETCKNDKSVFVFRKFKSKSHDVIDAFISYN